MKITAMNLIMRDFLLMTMTKLVILENWTSLILRAVAYIMEWQNMVYTVQSN